VFGRNHVKSAFLSEKMRYKNMKKSQKITKNHKKKFLHGRYKKNDFFGIFFKISYHGKPSCKEVFL
jgi:hypothetical protein